MLFINYLMLCIGFVLLVQNLIFDVIKGSLKRIKNMVGNIRGFVVCTNGRYVSLHIYSN